MAQRWKQAPPGSHWGEFGPDDQLGRMNLVTPAKVLQGMAEVKTGRSFCLSRSVPSLLIGEHPDFRKVQLPR